MIKQIQVWENNLMIKRKYTYPWEMTFLTYMYCTYSEPILVLLGAPAKQSYCHGAGVRRPSDRQSRLLIPWNELTPILGGISPVRHVQTICLLSLFSLLKKFWFFFFSFWLPLGRMRGKFQTTSRKVQVIFTIKPNKKPRGLALCMTRWQTVTT